MFLVVAAAPGPRRVEAVAVRRLRRERDARVGVVAAPDAPVDEARLGVVEHAIDGLELARRRGAQRRSALGASRAERRDGGPLRVQGAFSLAYSSFCDALDRQLRGVVVELIDGLQHAGLFRDRERDVFRGALGRRGRLRRPLRAALKRRAVGELRGSARASPRS